MKKFTLAFGAALLALVGLFFVSPGFAQTTTRLTEQIVTTLAVGSNRALSVAILDGSGNQITAFGGSGGTSHGDDAAFTIGGASSITPAGFLVDDTTPDSADEGDVGVSRMSAARIAYSALSNAAGTLFGTVRDTGSSDSLNVAIVDASGNQITTFGGSGGASANDDGVFTLGAASSINPVGFLVDDTTPDSADEGDVALARMSAARIAYHTIANAAGTLFATVRDTGSSDSINVAVVDASGNQITAFGGSGGTAHQDDAAFSIGSASSITPVGFLVDDTTPDSADEGDVGLARMSAARIAYQAITNVGGTLFATVRDTGSSDSLNVAIVDASGNQITSFGVSGEVDVTPASPSASSYLPIRLTDGSSFLTPSADWTISSAIGTAAPGLALEGKDFDGSALPQTASAAEGDAIPFAGSLFGIGYYMPVTENGAATSIVLDDAAATTAGAAFAIAFLADEAATDSVDEGDLGYGRMTLDRRVIVTDTPHTQGGLSTFISTDLDETEEDVKGSAGQIYAMWITNTTTATRYVRCYNDTAANVVVGTTARVFEFAIPGNSSDDVAANLNTGGHGVPFSTAISCAATTAAGATDTGAPGANDVHVNVFYK